MGSLRVTRQRSGSAFTVAWRTVDDMIKSMHWHILRQTSIIIVWLSIRRIWIFGTLPFWSAFPSMPDDSHGTTIDMCYQCDNQIETAQRVNPSLHDAKSRLAVILAIPFTRNPSQIIETPVTDLTLTPTSNTKACIPGLVNLGNTCFFNSATQVITFSVFYSKIRLMISLPKVPCLYTTVVWRSK